MKKNNPLLDVDVLYGVGFILAFLGSAAWIGKIAFLEFLAPLGPFGFLIIVVGAIISLVNKFSK